MNFKKSILFFALIFFNSFALHSQNWAKLKNGLGLIGDVYLYNDYSKNDLYLYGLFFSDREGNSLRGIAKWDGYDYVPIAMGGPLNPIVYEVVRYQNSLFVSTWVGYDSTLTNFFYWTNYNAELNKLDTLNYGLVDGPTFSLKVINDVLYANGLFNKCGNDSTWGICTFNGSNWHSLYNKPNPFDGNMSSIVWYKDQLYVGGNFRETNNSSELVNIFGILENGDLKKVGNGFFGTGFTAISSMVIYKDELYIGGYFLESDGNLSNHIIRWDGTEFKELAGGLDNQVTDMVVYKNELYVSGKFIYADGLYSPKIARWNGEQWFAFNTDNIDGNINDLQIFNEELYISGHFNTINGDTFNHVAKYAHQLPGNENALEIFINNPAEEIIIQYENIGHYDLAVSVSTINGQQVGSYLFPNEQGYIHKSIPMFGLASGVYIVSATTGDKRVNKKLLKLN